MGIKPIAFGACGALAGSKFKATVTRYEPGRPEEIVTQADFTDTSVKHMADVMYSLARSIVIPQQREANDQTGLKTKSAIITGWQPGEFFTGLDDVIRNYPLSNQVINKFGLERDSGYLQQAVLNAYQQSGMKFDDYISACRAVAGNPMSQNLNDLEIDTHWSPWIFMHMQNYSNGGEKAKASLIELQKFIYEKGKSIVQNLRAHSQAINNMSTFNRMSRFDPNDPTVGNRFSSIDLRPFGKAGQALVRLPGMRKALADGIRDELGFPKDKNGNHVHVLCPKVAGKDHDDRPLTNVAGAILNQMFIQEGHMTIHDLKTPYA